MPPPRRRRGGLSCPRWPVRRTSGSRGTAAALTRPGTPGRFPRSRRASRARCRCSIRPRAPAGCWSLDLDVPAGRAVHGRCCPDDRQRGAAEVAAQAAAIAELVARCGGQVLADVAPTGGRHVYILFAAALPWRELRDLCRAIALRFPAVDPAPMCSSAARSRPPGSRHKCGGWRLLTTPCRHALAAVEHPNGPEVWDGLLTEFAAELQQAETVATVEPVRRARRHRRPVGAPPRRPREPRP